MIESNTKDFYIKLDELNKKLNLVYPLFIMVFGTVGNLFTIYIFSRKCFKKTSIGTYYSYLAFIDTLVLCLGSVRFFLEANNNINITTISNLACKLLTSSMYILQQLSAWILAIASLDRIFLVRVPPTFIFKDVKKLKIHVIFATTLILTIVNIPNIIYLEVTNKEINLHNETTKKIKYCELTNDSFYNNNVGDVSDLLLFAVIPFLLMTFSSIIISQIIFFSKRKFYHGAHKRKREYQFAVTILAMNFLFLVLNLPICIHLLIRNLSDESRISYNQRVKYNFVYTISVILSYLNFSNSLFVNLALNHLFRKEFKKIFFKK